MISENDKKQNQQGIDKEESKTETGSSSQGNSNVKNFDFHEITVKTKQILCQQIEVTNKLAKTTFSADKIIRFISAILKTIRNFNLKSNLKSIERLSIQIGQLRRLLRVDRLCLIAKDYATISTKKEKKKIDYFLYAFKLMLVFGDISDLRVLLMQLKVIKQKNICSVRQRVANIYFYECIGWTFYYLYELMFVKLSEQQKMRNKMVVCRYILDTIVSHNDYSKKLFTLNFKFATLLSLLSAFLNLALYWK